MPVTNQQLIDILRGSNTQKISFSFTGTTGMKINIKATHFNRVADALSEGRISISHGNVPAGTAKYSARTAGTDAANTFYLPKSANIGSKDMKGLLVHESVHAVFDLYSSNLPWVDNEAAAHIAQGYYLRNVGYPRKWMHQDSGAYHGLMVVDAILDGQPELAQASLDALRDGLRNAPLYAGYINGTFNGDG